MNTSMLNLIIIPSDVDIHNIKNYDESTDGKIFSTLTDIKVNKVPSGYTILYRTSDFKNIDMEVLGNNIIKLFMENVPNTMINFSIFYMYEVFNVDAKTNEYVDNPPIDLDVVDNILTLEEIFGSRTNDEKFMFKYIRSRNIIDTIYYITKEYENLNIKDSDCEDDEDDEEYLDDFFESFNNDYYSDEDDEDEDDEDDNNTNPFDFLENNLRGYNPKLKYRNTKRVKGIPTSKVFRDDKNAKRSYNRHGVIICTDKDSRKRDKKIIKEFLKEFFPGNSEWKKNFRNDVLNRWMSTYCITKKNLKELEKTHRKAKNAKRNYINTEKTLDFTRRLFNVPIDRWDDPSK